MRQKDCYRKKGWGEVKGKVVVVAVEATKEVSRSGLMWALTNVVQPGDSIKLLGVISPFCSSISFMSLHYFLLLFFIIWQSDSKNEIDDSIFESASQRS